MKYIPQHIKNIVKQGCGYCGYSGKRKKLFLELMFFDFPILIRQHKGYVYISDPK